MNHLSGLIAAAHTPVHPDGSINLDRVDSIAEHLLESGVAGVFINGSTGEFAALNLDERMKLAERWRSAAGLGFPVVVHVGDTCLSNTRDLAAHAEKIRADGIAALAPFYNRPSDIGCLVDFCAAVAAAAPTRPFYYYHIPAMTGVDYPMIEFLQLAGSQIPTFAGIKYSHLNLMDLRQCLDYEDGRFNILFGSDQDFLGAMAMGAAGAVGSTYNFAAPVYLRMMKAFQSGDLKTAQAWQDRIGTLVSFLLQRGGHPAFKAVMGFLGVECGPMRAPYRNLTEEQRRALENDLGALGFFDLLSECKQTNEVVGDRP